MSGAEAAKELKLFAEALEKLKKPLQIASLKTIEGRLKQRVFNRGKDTGGNKIGDYSNAKLYADKDSFAKKSAFKPNTKRGNTMRLDGGYKELRDIQGFQTDYVDTDYTGSLRMSIAVGDAGSDVVLGFLDSGNAFKAESLETHFNKEIYQVTEEEEELGFQAAIAVLDNLAAKFGII